MAVVAGTALVAEFLCTLAGNVVAPSCFFDYSLAKRTLLIATACYIRLSFLILQALLMRFAVMLFGDRFLATGAIVFVALSAEKLMIIFHFRYANTAWRITFLYL